MKTSIAICAILSSLAMHGSANAKLTLFTDLAAFNHATELRVIEPNSAPPNSFRNVSNATEHGISYPDYAFMVDPGYAPALYDWGTGPVLLLDQASHLDFRSTFAFAADFGTLVPGSPVYVTIGGETTLVSTSGAMELNFYGWVSDSAFDTVALNTDATYIILDNVTRADAINIPPPTDVPEPGSPALLGLAALLLAHGRRRRVS